MLVLSALVCSARGQLLSQSAGLLPCAGGKLLVLVVVGSSKSPHIGIQGIALHISLLQACPTLLARPIHTHTNLL